MADAGRRQRAFRSAAHEQSRAKPYPRRRFRWVNHRAHRTRGGRGGARMRPSMHQVRSRRNEFVARAVRTGATATVVSRDVGWRRGVATWRAALAVRGHGGGLRANVTSCSDYW